MSLNYNLYRAKYRFGKYLPLKTPVDISLELSSNCNMRCSYCYHSDQENLLFTKGYMKTEVARKIIYQASDMGVNSLKFNFRGESTMHPDYTSITKLAKALSHGSTFIDRLANSNFKINKKVREEKFKGLASLTKVKISYDSFRKEVFEHQRAKGNHDLTTENIDLFYNHPERIKSETKMVIQAVRTKLNLNEDIKHECNKRWPEALISIRDVVEGRVDKDVDEFIHTDRDDSDRKPCDQAFVRMIVHHDGRVGPCCPATDNNLFIGRFPKQSLKEIFNSPAALTLRRKLWDKSAFRDNAACKNCSSFESYKNYKPVWDS